MSRLLPPLFISLPLSFPLTNPTPPDISSLRSVGNDVLQFRVAHKEEDVLLGAAEEDPGRGL
jgi:hypothetical protein